MRNSSVQYKRGFLVFPGPFCSNCADIHKISSGCFVFNTATEKGEDKVRLIIDLYYENEQEQMIGVKVSCFQVDAMLIEPQLSNSILCLDCEI